MSHVARRLRNLLARIASSRESRSTTRYRTVQRTTQRRCLLESLEPRTMLAASIASGLDQLVDVINNDPGLNYNVATSEVQAAAESAQEMNYIIAEAIEQTGVANNGQINAADVRDLNAYIQNHYKEQWIVLHGDDGDCLETGFHLVQNDGAITKMFGGHNAVDTVADGLYHMGFDIRCNRFLNEDGNANASVERVAYWLNELYGDDS